MITKENVEQAIQQLTKMADREKEAVTTFNEKLKQKESVSEVLHWYGQDMMVASEQAHLAKVMLKTLGTLNSWEEQAAYLVRVQRYYTNQVVIQAEHCLPNSSSAMANLQKLAAISAMSSIIDKLRWCGFFQDYLGRNYDPNQQARKEITDVLEAIGRREYEADPDLVNRLEALKEKLTPVPED